MTLSLMLFSFTVFAISVKANSVMIGTTSYPSIQAAVNAAMPGAVINVGPGTYYETVNVTKSLTFLGPQAGVSPNVSGSRTNVSQEATIVAQLLSGSDIAAFLVNTPGVQTVTIKGFRITNGLPLFDGHLVNNAAIQIDFEKNIVENGSILYGASLYAAITIADNRFTNIDNTAIFLIGIGTVTVTDNVITNARYGGIIVTAYPTPGSPVTLNASILRNKISYVGIDGIQLAHTLVNAVVQDNEIDHANTSQDPRLGGIVLWDPKLFTGTKTITNNKVTNSYNGLAIVAGDYGLAGDDVSGKNIIVTNNSFDETNTNKAITNPGPGTLNATCNWLGTTNCALVSNRVFGKVIYIPFLLAGTDASPAIGFQPAAPCGTCVSTNSCGFTNGSTYFGGFEGGTASISNTGATGTASSDLSYGLPRNGSYEIVHSVNELGGGGYLNVQPHSGNYFLAAHTSNDVNDKIWSSKMTVVPGTTYHFCTYVTLLKNLGNGANFILGLYANGIQIGTGRVTSSWTQICGDYQVPLGVTTVEFSIQDPKKGLFFVAIDDICVTQTQSLAPVITSNQIEMTSDRLLEPALGELTVKTFPNPSASNFEIYIRSASSAPVTVRVIDAMGRAVQILNSVQPNTTIRTGSQFRRGNYYLEITQGNVRKLAKLIKQ